MSLIKAHNVQIVIAFYYNNINTFVKLIDCQQISGYSYGLRKGAQIAAEIGFYQGFIHAWIGILERDETSKQRKLLALKSLLELTRRFHRTNLHDEDCFKRLEAIRAKFKQVNSLLTTCQSPFTADYNNDFVPHQHHHQQPPPQQNRYSPHHFSSSHSTAHADFVGHTKADKLSSEMSF